MMVPGSGVLSPPRRKMTERARETVYLEFGRWMFDSKGLAATTRYTRGLQVRRADEWLRTNRESSLPWATAKDLQAYLFSCTPTPMCRNHIRAGLVCFGQFLVENGWRKDNPASDLPRLPTKRAVPKALTAEDAHRIVMHASNFEPSTYTMIVIMLYGGLRKTEARLLEWHRVSPDYRWLTILGKGGKERQVPLHALASEALKSWHRQCPDPVWIFPSTLHPGRPMAAGTMHNLVRMIGDAAGIDGLHPHILRHTVATRMLERTGDLRAVQEFLGHSSPETTVIYTKVRPAKLQEASDRLDF